VEKTPGFRPLTFHDDFIREAAQSRREYALYLQQLPTSLREEKLSIRIHRAYPLAEAAQTHAAFECRESIGRILLLP
jgi:NADPH:quinone reductase-like Zn-dependent oxidoreductase